MYEHAIRIGYCIDTLDIGGTELNAVRTLEALDRRRFQVTVFHLHRSGPLLERYRALGVELVHLPIGRLYMPRTALQGLSFRRALRRRRIQVVHTHDLYTNIFAAPWARLAGCCVIASRRWLDAAPRPGLLRLNRWSYRFAHRVISNSTLAARLLADQEGVPAVRILELPNFLDERAFERVGVEQRSARRRGWGVPPEAFVVGSVARLAPVKNHATLLRALAQLPTEVHAVLIGAGPERAALGDLARNLQIESRVHFTGELLEAGNLHQFFDASVLCSRSEGSPNSVLEALAAGCPVIATPVGGVPEIIVDRQTGLLVPVDAAAALAAGLAELRQDAQLRSRLSEAGIARARMKYHRNVVIAQLESLYQMLARPAPHQDALLT
ncbi:MAG: glycosyltransferase [Gammaproteobacteria bacterium]|nr:glycosyltransferase [Gammaproteobacteria bacterium]MBV8404240.1 glycosyltransferase [Gammaproteobacteria bacterium]